MKPKHKTNFPAIPNVSPDVDHNLRRILQPMKEILENYLGNGGRSSGNGPTGSGGSGSGGGGGGSPYTPPTPPGPGPISVEIPIPDLTKDPTYQDIIARIKPIKRIQVDVNDLNKAVSRLNDTTGILLQHNKKYDDKLMVAQIRVDALNGILLSHQAQFDSRMAAAEINIQAGKDGRWASISNKVTLQRFGQVYAGTQNLLYAKDGEHNYWNKFKTPDPDATPVLDDDGNERNCVYYQGDIVYLTQGDIDSNGASCRDEFVPGYKVADRLKGESSPNDLEEAIYFFRAVDDIYEGENNTSPDIDYCNNRDTNDQKWYPVESGILTGSIIRLNANGHIAGYGMTLDGKGNSDFTIVADRFKIVTDINADYPDSEPKTVFQVYTVPTTVNGMEVKPGLYLDGDMIATGTITANMLAGNFVLVGKKIASTDAVDDGWNLKNTGSGFYLHADPETDAEKRKMFMLGQWGTLNGSTDNYLQWNAKDGRLEVVGQIRQELSGWTAEDAVAYSTSHTQPENTPTLEALIGETSWSIADENGWTGTYSNTVIWRASKKVWKDGYGEIRQIDEDWLVERVKDVKPDLVEYVFRRQATTPTKPTGLTNSSTQGLIPASPTGWLDNPPSGTDPLWMSCATLVYSPSSVNTDHYAVSSSGWSTPIRIDGIPGENGDSISLEKKYSTASPNSMPSPPPASGWSNYSSVNASNYYWIAIRVVTTKGDGSKVYGVWEVSRWRGEQGEDGIDGPPGPAAVYRGDWSSTTSYLYQVNSGVCVRRDVVKYNGQYYISTQASLNKVPSSSSTYWETFGAVFESVATKLLLAEDAIITKTLTMGSPSGWGAVIGGTLAWGNVDFGGTTLTGIISGNGFGLSSNDTSTYFMIGNTTNQIVWDGPKGTLGIKGKLIANGNLYGNSLTEHGTKTGNMGSIYCRRKGLTLFYVRTNLSKPMSSDADYVVITLKYNNYEIYKTHVESSATSSPYCFTVACPVGYGGTFSFELSVSSPWTASNTSINYINHYDQGVD